MLPNAESPYAKEVIVDENTATLPTTNNTTTSTKPSFSCIQQLRYLDLLSLVINDRTTLRAQFLGCFFALTVATFATMLIISLCSILFVSSYTYTNSQSEIKADATARISTVTDLLLASSEIGLTSIFESVCEQNLRFASTSLNYGLWYNGSESIYQPLPSYRDYAFTGGAV
jgi:hypothetical protein